ncbi:MAG: hypothetical protein ACI8PT_000963 [Gammaproteobacteria bacterium]|jgi:hypothetical protein
MMAGIHFTNTAQVKTELKPLAHLFRDEGAAALFADAGGVNVDVDIAAGRYVLGERETTHERCA